jgi:hypothetical protein
MINVIVEFDLPEKADTDKLAERFANGPEFYLDVPGLISKSWVIAEDGMSLAGIYLWQDRESAMNWYDGTGKARIEALGIEPKMKFYDCFALTDVDKGEVRRPA